MLPRNVCYRVGRQRISCNWWIGTDLAIHSERAPNLSTQDSAHVGADSENRCIYCWFGAEGVTYRMNALSVRGTDIVVAPFHLREAPDGGGHCRGGVRSVEDGSRKYRLEDLVCVNRLPHDAHIFFCRTHRGIGPPAIRRSDLLYHLSADRLAARAAVGTYFFAA